MNQLPTPKLHLITGHNLLLVRGLGWREELIEAVVAAVWGGVDVVQLREKDLAPEELVALGRALRDALPEGASLIINGSAEVAIEVGAHGVHLPEGAPLPEVPPPGLIFGRSIHSVEAARAAEAEGADYLFAGSIFQTTTHPDTPPRGIQFLREVCRAVTVPVIAIGGITPDRAQQCLDAGASGIAVRSFILGAADPEAAARSYNLRLEGTHRTANND